MVYSESDDDEALNLGIERCTSSQEAVATLSADADPTGVVSIPIMGMHPANHAGARCLGCLRSTPRALDPKMKGAQGSERVLVVEGKVGDAAGDAGGRESDDDVAGTSGHG